MTKRGNCRCFNFKFQFTASSLLLIIKKTWECRYYFHWRLVFIILFSQTCCGKFIILMVSFLNLVYALFNSPMSLFHIMKTSLINIFFIQYLSSLWNNLSAHNLLWQDPTIVNTKSTFKYVHLKKKKKTVYFTHLPFFNCYIVKGIIPIFLNSTLKGN